MAPGKKASVMFSSTVLSGGWTFESRCIVKMYWADTGTPGYALGALANV